jgi:hypothetical protein
MAKKRSPGRRAAMQRFLRILRKDDKEFLVNLDLITGVSVSHDGKDLRVKIAFVGGDKETLHNEEGQKLLDAIAGQVI